MKKIITLCAALCVAACGSTPSPVIDDTVGTGGSSNVGVYDASTCNTLTNIGSVVNSTTNTNPPPTMTGGTIVDGTYVLTSVVMYTGVPVDIDASAPVDTSGGGATISNGSNLRGNDPVYVMKMTMVITGNVAQIVSNTGGPEEYDTGIITTSGTKFKMTFSCMSTPGLGTLADYTSNVPTSTAWPVLPAATTLTTLNSDNSVYTFIKQ